MSDKNSRSPNITPDPENVSVKITSGIGDTVGFGHAPLPLYTVPAKSSFSAIKMTKHTGPLPDPDTLRRYGEIDASLPGRIMAMAELGHQASIQRANKNQNHFFVLELAGRVSAFLFALCVLGLAGWMVYLHYPYAAATIVTGVLGGAIYTLYSGRETKAVKPHENDKTSQPEDVALGQPKPPLSDQAPR